MAEPVTLDFTRAIPIGAPPADPQAGALQSSVAYGATQDPDQYANLLKLQKQTGVPPVLSNGNQAQVRQAADVNSIDYPKFLATFPRTSEWVSNPENAAVSGVSEVQRLGGIEQNAASMRAYTPTFAQNLSDKLLDLGQWMTGGAMSREQLRQNFWQGPLTRGAADVAGGAAGLVGNIGSFLGWHGDGASKQNLLQRIESNLDPANAGVNANGAPDTGNQFDWLMKNVAPMIPAVLATGGTSLLARTLGIGPTAAKVLAGLTVGGMFDADQAGKTYTAVAASGAGDYAARLAANRVAAISAGPNALFGATDVVPLLRDNPLLTSIALGGATGATGQIGQNVTTGQPWAKGVPGAMVQGAAMQGGMHLGMSAFGENMSGAVDAAEQSKLRERSPEKFDEAMQTIFAGDQSLRIPSDQFTSYFKGKGVDPAEVARGLNASNYPEAVLAGGDVEIPPADFLSKLEPEHQKALLEDIVDPSTGLTARQHQEGLAELQEWATGGGAAQLAADAAAADAETAATPEYSQVKEQIRQRYVDAGETPEVAETLATKDANAYSNLARNAGMKPSELLNLYNPKVTMGEAPEALYQEGADEGEGRQSMSASESPGSVPEREAGNRQPVQEGATNPPPQSTEDTLDVKRVRALGDTLKADAAHGQNFESIFGSEDWAEMSEDQRREAIEQDYEEAEKDETAERERRDKNQAADDDLDRRVAYMDGKQQQVEELLRTHGLNYAVKGASTYSRYLNVDLPNDESAEIRVSDHAPPVGRGGMKEGGADYHDEADVSLHPGDDAMGKVRDLLSDKGIHVLFQNSEDGARGWFRLLPDGTYEIGKTKIGDLSTFVHEPAHAYLKILGDLSKREGASDVLKSDYQKVLDFLGARDGEPLTRDQQETWARANEQYLREGNAPSPGLKGTFQRFALWLGSIYKKASDLGVNLSDDIRGVFDRMYAAEDGVNRAESEAGPKLFTSAEEAGWTDEQFKNYAEQNNMSVEQAKSHVLGLLNEAAVRERTQAWREEEQNVRAAVTADVDQRPEYSAIRALRRGSLDDGTELTMSRDALVKQFGEERVKELQKAHPGLYRNEAGDSTSEDPEIVAEVFGFHSAEEMMRALEAAPRRSAAIDTATRDYMTAKHGDIRYDGSLKDQADLAVANDQRAQNLHREMRALDRRNSPEFELRNAERELNGYLKEQQEQAQAKERKKTAKDMESLANTLIKQTDKRREQIEARDQRIASLKEKVAALGESVKQAKQEEQAGKSFAQATAPFASYRDAAHQMVEKKAVADLQPTRYLDASRVYAREAFDALARGDYWGAKQAKHKELMNHFLFREATEAKEYVGKFEAYAKRVQKTPAQQKLGLAGADYLDQFNRILGRYGLGPQVPAGERSLAEWAASQYDQGKEPAIDPAILNEARSINYRNAPVSEIRAVHDALVNVRKLASLELGMEVNGKKVEFSAAIENMQAQARETLPAKPTRVLKGNATLGEKISDFAERGDALLMRTERLMEWLDGGKTGPWHDNLWNHAADAQGNEYKLQEQVTKQLGDAIENMPKEQRAKMLDKVTVDGIPETVTRHDLVSMAFNMGNDGNLDRLHKTFVVHGWDPDAIHRIAGMLTREEWQFVQDGWDSLKPLGQAQSDLERRLTGLPPLMVKPAPLDLTLADGTRMKLDGGYYPIVMDPRYGSRGAQQDAGSTAQNLMEAGYGRAATSRGNMQARTGFGGPLQLDYEQVLTQHTAKVIKDITHREFMLAANKLLLDPAIRQTMRQSLGEGYEEKMMPWLRSIINDRNGSAVQGLGDFSRLMRSLRTNLTLATLSFKISTSLLQWTHAPRMLLSTNPGSYAQALVDFLAHPAEMTDQIKDLSPNEMAARGDNLDRDIRAVLRGDPGIKRGVARVGNVSIKYTDHLLSFPLWLSVYRDGLKEHAGLTEDRAQDLAVHAADSAVRLGLGSGAPKDLPPIMRSNDLSKLMTMFYSFHNGIYGQVRDIGHQFRQNGGAGSIGAIGKLSYGLALSVLAPAVLGGIVSGNGPKDGENKGLWAAKRALLFAADTVPGLRDAASALDSDGEVKNPLMNVLSKGMKATMEATSSSDEKDWKGIGLSYLEVGGDLAGIPGTTQAMKPLRYLNQVQRGNVENPNVWDAVAGSAHH